MDEDKLNVTPAQPQDGDDTVTRKTIRLRPAAPVAPAAPAAKPAAAAAPAAGSGEDTQTRRTDFGK